MSGSGPAGRPNFVLITTDDQRYDAMGCAGNRLIRTPHIDRLAERGVRFAQAFVTLSICSPSRAACLTGRYGRSTGVTRLNAALGSNEVTFAEHLRRVDYRTGMVGKWHVGGRRPIDCGFDWSVYFEGNGPPVDRLVTDNGRRMTAKGPVDDYLGEQAQRFLKERAAGDSPFLLWLCTQSPHMAPARDWFARPETLESYVPGAMRVPANWRDDLTGKPPYLATGRSRVQGCEDGYDSEDGLRRNTARYYAAITDLDRILGRMLESIDSLGLRGNTYVLFTSDNGWFLGEHGFTSKVLAYEESIRVPLIVAGPGMKGQVDDHLVLNVDLATTVLELAGLRVPAEMHGRSLVPLLGSKAVTWRSSILYEAPAEELGVRPTLAVRTERFKYIQTYDDEPSGQPVY
jgi:arylsulfatase A-like enzyme